MNKITMGIGLGFILGGAACGVKGPPLPPVADTPSASDRTTVSGPPAALPSPKPKMKSKRRH
jgi:hypothetical protein